MFWLELDLQELDELDRRVFGFGHNRGLMASVHDRDYVRPESDSILAKLRIHLAIPPDARVTLLTIPRIAGYVFNPVNFYLIHDDDSPSMLIAEVRNTFGEMHHYQATLQPQSDGSHTCRVPKRFYVSPFLHEQGEYEVTYRRSDDRCDIRIELREKETLLFAASMQGVGRPLTSMTLIATIARLPLFAATVMLRIHAQALLLILRKRIPAREKPPPSDPATRPVDTPRLTYRWRARLLRFLSRRESNQTSRSISHV